jgi:hypothetical protein
MYGEGLFEPELILPEQLGDGSRPHDGPRRLLFELFTEGIATVMGRLGCTEWDYWSDYHWLVDDSEAAPTSFRFLCGLFDMNPDYLLPPILEAANKAQARIKDGYLPPEFPDRDMPNFKANTPQFVNPEKRLATLKRKLLESAREISCVGCGAPFIVTFLQHRRERCDACCREAHRERGRQQRARARALDTRPQHEDRPCGHCGTTFQVKRSHWSQHRFCGALCRSRSRWRRVREVA